MKVLITERISNNRFKDNNGYLIISNNVIARTGKQIYKHNQVYDNSNDSFTDVEVDRPEAEVFSPETIASFENKPITILHPNEKVNSYNQEELGKGFFRDIRRSKAINPETNLEEPVLMGTAVVTHQEAIDDIEAGKWTHWSCGYDTEIIQTDSPYQTKIRGNHIALCTTPRAGKIAAISDEKDNVFVSHFIQILTDAVDSNNRPPKQGRTFGQAFDKYWRRANDLVEESYKKDNRKDIEKLISEVKAAPKKERREEIDASKLIEMLMVTYDELKKEYKDSFNDAFYNQYLVQYFVFKNGKRQRKERMVYNIPENNVFNEITKKLALLEKVNEMYIDIENVAHKKSSNTRQVEEI